MPLGSSFFTCKCNIINPSISGWPLGLCVPVTSMPRRERPSDHPLDYERPRLAERWPDWLTSSKPQRRVVYSLGLCPFLSGVNPTPTSLNISGWHCMVPQAARQPLHRACRICLNPVSKMSQIPWPLLCMFHGFLPKVKRVEKQWSQFQWLDTWTSFGYQEFWTPRVPTTLQVTRDSHHKFW
jgi:hypothetical protein